MIETASSFQWNHIAIAAINGSSICAACSQNGMAWETFSLIAYQSISSDEGVANASQHTSDAPHTDGKYAPVNGLNLYYEIHGEGPPLVLLHGGLGTVATHWGEVLPSLVHTHQVIGVELQAHGHTADIDRPLRYELMADDVAALIAHLGLASADIVGFSLGGGVALQVAIRHPNLVRKAVIISAPCKRDGWYPEVLAGQATLNAEVAQQLIVSPPYQAYASVAPQPENWSTLVIKTGEVLRQDYDWSDDVATLTTPVLIAIGDADSVRTAHAVEMFGLLGGGKADGAMGGMPNSQLAILPATTHFTIMEQPVLLPIVTAFLAAPMPEAAIKSDIQGAEQ
jgi:pimeloyl-ACP methyl ester carboxylesterase